MSPTTDTVRIGAVGDLHCKRTSQGLLQPILVEAAGRCDVLLLCGDLTDLGLPEEAQVFAKELAGVRVPMLGVLGNHDVESGHEKEVTAIMQEAGVTMLDGDATEVAGIGFAGVKGFAGGFGQRMLEPWGEPAIKAFVQETIEEGVKLQRALSRLRTPRRVAVLHYAPIAATVEGEPLEIFPFLGSSRLEEPLNRFEVAVAFHGHAHRGTLEGRTSANVPVYNVAMPLLRRSFPDQLPVKFIELTVAAPVDAESGEPRRRRGDLEAEPVAH